MEKTVLVILVSRRDDKIIELQKILSQYGGIIKTRLGLHDISEGVDCGLIILELVGGEKEKKEAFQKALQKHESIKFKLVSLSI